MIWHIFKKDWKLLWVFVITVASLHWIAAFIIFKLGLFGEDAMFEMLSEAVPILAFFASMFLIAAIVHVEAIPGVRQDWLVRPIRRRNLLLEKFLFVVLMVEGPIFAANLFQGLANGFSLRSSLLAAMSHVIFLLFFLILPLFAFASVTRNMTEAFIFGCGCTFVIGVFLTLTDYLNGYAHGTLAAVTHSGIGWIGEVFRLTLAAIAASIILGLQYFRRKTMAARFLVIAFGLLILASQFLPWKPAFAIEERLSPKPAAGAHTEVTFNPVQGKFKSPSGLVPSSENVQRNRGEENAEVFLPLQATGVRNDAILLTDRVEVHVTGQDGRVVYHGIGDSLEVAREGSNPAEEPVYQQIAVPMSVYHRAKDQAVQVRVDYSLTLFGLAGSYSMPALNGDERMPEWGWCQTKMNEAGTAVELHCMEPGKGPTCGTAFLENASTGARNPARSTCRSDYSPYGYHPLPDSFVRFGTNLLFRDASGLAKFPVDGPQLPQSRVVIRVYEPEDHFSRSLVIPQIKLKNWEAQ
jgi:hypothetical protein